MPELPEVETVVRGIRPDLLNARIRGADVFWHRTLEGTPLDLFQQVISTRTVRDVTRRGKYIIIVLDQHYLVVHLRMTGRLYFSDKPEGDDAWVRFGLHLDHNRYLVFSDSRKFGRVQYCENLDFLEEKLGPEPLDLSPMQIAEILRGSKRAIKPFLLDQKKIAGIGNIYADESLFRAGVDPRRPVDRLTKAERLRLGEIIPEILRAAIRHEGASISWYRKPDGTQGESQLHFSVYGRGGEPCVTCGTTISKIVLGQRGTHFCPKCQKR